MRVILNILWVILAGWWFALGAIEAVRSTPGAEADYRLNPRIRRPPRRPRS